MEKEQRQRNPRKTETRQNKDGCRRKTSRAKLGKRARREMRHIQKDPGLLASKCATTAVIKEILADLGDQRLQRECRDMLQVAGEDFITEMLRGLETSNTCQKRASFGRAEVFLEGFKLCNPEIATCFTLEDLEQHAERAGVTVPVQLRGTTRRPGIPARTDLEPGAQRRSVRAASLAVSAAAAARV
jgi:hypothetical protein